MNQQLSFFFYYRNINHRSIIIIIRPHWEPMKEMGMKLIDMCISFSTSIFNS